MDAASIGSLYEYFPNELHACMLKMEESLAHLLEETMVQGCGLPLADSDTTAHLVA